MNPKRVCVIGAGPSGLTTTKTLLQAGLDVDCIEMSPHIGGHWVIDNPSGRSSAYRSLRTNTTKRMSRFSDFNMPDAWQEFPRADQVREWLETYVDTFGFRARIETSTALVHAAPRDGGGWTATLRGPDGKTRTEQYDAVVAASGSYWDRRVPEWPGEFNGQIVHAQDYRDPTTPLDMTGADVIVVGVGNTGCELACEIAAASDRPVHLSARSGTWIMPKLINGAPASESTPMTHPTDPVPDALRALPTDQREHVLAESASARIRDGFGKRMKRFEALGMPPAPDHPLIKRPTISQDILAAMESGAVVARPAIERLDGDGVMFTDGTRVVADVILCATGYRLSYPYLDPAVADTRDDDLTLFCGIVSPEHPDLFFIGVSRPTGAFWPIAEAQAQFAAAALTGAYAMPDAEERRRRARPMLNRLAMNPGLYGLELREELARGHV